MLWLIARKIWWNLRKMGNFEKGITRHCWWNILGQLGASYVSTIFIRIVQIMWHPNISLKLLWHWVEVLMHGFSANIVMFCLVMLDSVSWLCRYVLVNKLLTGLWESKQERLIRTILRQQWRQCMEKKQRRKWRNMFWDSTVWLLAMTRTNVWRGKHWKRRVLKPTDVKPTFFLG